MSVVNVPTHAAPTGDNFRPMPAVLAQLRARVVAGERPEAVLDEMSIRHPRLRARYVAAVAHLADPEAGAP